MYFNNFTKGFGLSMLLMSMASFAVAQSQTAKPMVMNENQEAPEFYDFKVKTLSDQTFDLSQLRGKRVLIVNTASECGFTPQYAQLQELYLKYGGDKFTILGFPSNDFGGQEPGTNQEIAAFCQKNYGVTFPMMAKVNVIGDDRHPLFAWLTDSKLNQVMDAEITWNFNKFLIDENGKLVAAFPSTVEPTDGRIMTFAAGEEW